MRCLAIAQEADLRDWTITVAGRLSAQALGLAAQTAPNANVRVLTPGVDGEVGSLNDLIQELSPSLVHLDSYEKALADIDCGQAILSNSQDGSFGARPADLHIDANLGAECRWVDDGSTSIALLGANVMQIRQEVRVLRHEVGSLRSAPLNVLLVLGGTDPVGATPRVAGAMDRAGVPLHLSVVCRETLHDEVRKSFHSPDSTLSLYPFVTNLPALANQQDLVVTAAGTSTWDFANMGVPIALISTVDNHIEGYEACVAAGLVFPLGKMAEGGLDDHVRSALVSATDPCVLRRMSEKSRALIDGDGTRRILDTWEKLLGANDPCFRSQATAQNGESMS